MRFINFDKATSFVPCNTLTEDGKTEASAIHFVSSDDFIVTRIEFSKDELKAIRDSGGQAYVIFGPGCFRPMPFAIQARDPFVRAPEAEPKKAAGKIVGIDGKPLS